MDTMTSSIGKSPNAEILDQGAFLKMLAVERKRSERSQRRFVLMLVRSGRLRSRKSPGESAEALLRILCDCTRETDIKGWYAPGVIGVIFTEIGDTPGRSVTEALSNKVKEAACVAMGLDEFDESHFSFHVYPEDVDRGDPPPPVDPTLYADVDHRSSSKRINLGLKRMMDVAGSLFGLLLLAPVMVTIAILIKLTSRGPVLFRQQRIGHYGRPFTFLKFRSMYCNNNPAIHKDYVTQFIAAKRSGASTAGEGAATYKLTGDPRITKIGRFLRRTSLDELPQLLNVLKGDMSLVGPRPPVAYEFAVYEHWHKHRLVAVRPGITGLWQVAGRSRVTFDEMVRLDLRYATSWSLWLDISILLQTPRAVLSGQGAY